MPWEYLLSGASGAGIVLIVSVIFLKKLIERGVDARFDVQLESHRAELNRILENQKTELDIWGSVRQDLLAEIWKAYKQISQSMASVLSVVQEPFAFFTYKQMMEELTNEKARFEIAKELKKQTIKYRQLLHEFDPLIPDEAYQICQKFFDTTFELSEFLDMVTDEEKPIDEAIIKDVWSKNISDFLKNEKAQELQKLIPEEQLEALFLSQRDDVFRYNTKIQELKNHRNAFSAYITEYFGLQDVMPQMIQAETNDA